MKRWMKKQMFEPKCIAIDAHYCDVVNTRLEYIFECEDYVLVQYGGMHPHLEIQVHWNDYVLASTDDIYDCDNVQCAEHLFENSHGNSIVSKDIVDSIIYKLMVGDIVLDSKFS